MDFVPQTRFRRGIIFDGGGISEKAETGTRLPNCLTYNKKNDEFCYLSIWDNRKICQIQALLALPLCLVASGVTEHY